MNTPNSRVAIIAVLLIGWMSILAGCHSTATREGRQKVNSQNIPATANRVSVATEQVLKDMGYQPWTNQLLGDVTRLEYRTNDASRVIVWLKTAGRSSTRVSVEVSSNQNKNLGRDILERIDKKVAEQR